MLAGSTVQQREPLLQREPAPLTPLIQTIQSTQQHFGEAPASPSSTNSRNQQRTPPTPDATNGNGAAGTVKYTQLARLPQNHIDELNFRLQTLNEHTEIQYAEVVASPMPAFGSDINPSVGDISDKESELNIRQLESTVSSLSGVNSSTVGSPLSERTVHNRRETDF